MSPTGPSLFANNRSSGAPSLAASLTTCVHTPQESLRPFPPSCIVFQADTWQAEVPHENKGSKHETSLAAYAVFYLWVCGFCLLVCWGGGREGCSFFSSPFFFLSFSFFFFPLPHMIDLLSSLSHCSVCVLELLAPIHGQHFIQFSKITNVPNVFTSCSATGHCTYVWKWIHMAYRI